MENIKTKKQLENRKEQKDLNSNSSYLQKTTKTQKNTENLKNQKNTENLINSKNKGNKENANVQEKIEEIPHSDLDDAHALALNMIDQDASVSVRTLENNVSDHNTESEEFVETLKENFEKLKLENPDLDESFLNEIVYKNYGQDLNLNYIEAPQIAEAAKVIAILKGAYHMPVVIDSGATSNFISRQIVKDLNLDQK